MPLSGFEAARRRGLRRGAPKYGARAAALSSASSCLHTHALLWARQISPPLVCALAPVHVVEPACVSVKILCFLRAFGRPACSRLAWMMYSCILFFVEALFSAPRTVHDQGDSLM